MVARDDAVYLGVGQYLVESSSSKEIVLRVMLNPIAGLAVSPHGTDRRLVVLLDDHGLLYWDTLNADRSTHFQIELSDPRAVILRNSHLVIHGHGTWKIYTATDDKVQCVRELPYEVEYNAFGLLRPGAARQVGLCTADGHVRVYELP